MPYTSITLTTGLADWSKRNWKKERRICGIGKDNKEVFLKLWEKAEMKDLLSDQLGRILINNVQTGSHATPFPSSV